MDDLTAFLTAQLDEDERVAREAITDYDGDANWVIEAPNPDESYGKPRLFWLDIMHSTSPETIPPGMAQHIARFDPARELAKVKADRAILDLHAPDDGYDPNGPVCATCGE